jgi:sterol desaturase/sphingolipid hydroxylase (fatty acid hydroxylase superfamily)
VDDFLFYWSHRLAHHKLFYATIHKQHHLFKYTLPIATEYCHPLEDLFVNTLSSIAGPLLLNTHVTVFWLYSGLKLYQSIDAHSQYVLPFPLSPWNIAFLGIDCGRAHSFHHSNNAGMYGGFTRFWDWVGGSDKHYKAHLARLAAQDEKKKA